MNENFYRVGQAAKELRISPYQIRRLCDARAIDADLTDAGHWRIPIAEVARLKKDGMPSLPASLPATPAPAMVGTAGAAVPPAPHGRVARPTYEERGLLAKPSPAVVGALEKTMVSEHKLRQLQIKKDKTATKDWLRDRKRRLQQEEDAQRAQFEQRREAVECDQWRRAWLDQGVQQIPYDEPPAAQLEATEAIENALSRMDHRQNEALTRRMIDQVIEKALAPWRRQRSLEDAIQSVADGFPYDLRYDSQWERLFIDAKEAARSAIIQADKNSSITRPTLDLLLNGTQASQPYVQKFNHKKRCQDLAVPAWDWDVSPDDEEAAAEAIIDALDATDVNTPDRGLQQTKEMALAPFQAKKRVLEERKRIALETSQQLRQEQDRQERAKLNQQREDEQRANAKSRLIENVLDHPFSATGLYSYLERLVEKHDFDESASSLWTEVREAIRPQLEQEVEADDAPEDVEKLMRRLAREELGI